MMKKLFSLTLAMVTALGLMLPASAAEETTDEALARVTQAVKAALDLDTDAYSCLHCAPWPVHLRLHC